MRALAKIGATARRASAMAQAIQAYSAVRGLTSIFTKRDRKLTHYSRNRILDQVSF